MKQILLFLALGIVTQTTQSQYLTMPYDTLTHRVSYTEIIYVDTVSKAELFGRALEWIALNYKSANNVIQLKDEERGKIIAKGLFRKKIEFDYGGIFDASVYHTVIVEFKNGRCKVQMTNFSYDYVGTQETSFENGIASLETVYGNKPKFASYKKSWVQFYQDCDKEIHLTLNSFSDFLQKPEIPKKDDW